MNDSEGYRKLLAVVQKQKGKTSDEGETVKEDPCTSFYKLF